MTAIYKDAGRPVHERVADFTGAYDAGREICPDARVLADPR